MNPWVLALRVVGGFALLLEGIQFFHLAVLVVHPLKAVVLSLVFLAFASAVMLRVGLTAAPRSSSLVQHMAFEIMLLPALCYAAFTCIQRQVPPRDGLELLRFLAVEAPLIYRLEAVAIVAFLRILTWMAEQVIDIAMGEKK